MPRNGGSRTHFFALPSFSQLLCPLSHRPFDPVLSLAPRAAVDPTSWKSISARIERLRKEIRNDVNAELADFIRQGHLDHVSLDLCRQTLLDRKMDAHADVWHYERTTLEAAAELELALSESRRQAKRRKVAE